ncbi:MAG: hypothetical protein ACOCWZ_01305 [Spirochaetota bacterium]
MRHLLKTLPVTICLFAIFTISCSKEIQKKSLQADKPDDQDLMVLEYQKEGFISPDRYRVIIVVPAENCNEPSSITELARKRAVLSLRKYLMSQDIPVNHNAQAYILNLVHNHGTLKKHDTSRSTRYCFFFDINKNNLKHSLDTISQQR